MASALCLCTARHLCRATDRVDRVESARRPASIASHRHPAFLPLSACVKFEGDVWTSTQETRLQGCGRFIIVAALVAIGRYVAVGIVANDRHGRNGWAWFLLAICISPLMALLFLIAVSGPVAAMAGAPSAPGPPKPQISRKSHSTCAPGAAVRSGRKRRTALTADTRGGSA